MRRCSTVFLAIAPALAISCLGDVEVPPAPPTAQGVVSPTPSPVQTLMGTKLAGTAVLIDEEIVVPHDESTTWSYEVMLEVGENRFILSAERESGRRSETTTEVIIVLEPPCPATPTLETVPKETQLPQLALSGTKNRGLSIVLNSQEIVPANDETSWTHMLMLPDNDDAYDFSLVARDAKGQDSDPVRFSVTLDRQAPAILRRYPEVSQQDVATNAQVTVVFDDDLKIGGITPPPETLLIRQGQMVIPGLLSYQPKSRALSWSPQNGMLPPNTELNVTVDPAFIEDTAGNPAPLDPVDWSYTFITGAAPDLTAPPAPVLDPVAPQVETDFVWLTGGKGPLTSLLVNGEPVIAISPETTWTYRLPLPVGTSSISIASTSVQGVETAIASTTIERIQQRPAAPVLEQDAPTQADREALVLMGTKPAGTAVLLSGNPVVCTSEDEGWSFQTTLNPGINDLVLQTRDEAGVLSEPTLHSVEFAQRYEGLVPDGFSLNVSLILRDLSQVTEVRNEFVTGANNYSIDAWIEGPIGLDETCEIRDGQRQNIKYVATIQNYIGTKAQHKVPFADDDYRGTDYLASLITVGAFSFLGLNAESQRRGDDGKELDGLLGSITETDLRDNIDCFGSPLVDICTRATVNNGPVELVSWTPRRREGQGLLEQGDYLLFLLINLDRDGSWLSANDFETCWGDIAFNEIGMHRIVQRVSLGSSPYTLTIPQSAELSGPDREGAGKLHFVGEEGVTITWGPSN